MADRSRALSRLRALARIALRAPERQDARFELLRRLRGEPPLPAGVLRNVLVLCHGNICRSPFAAALLAARLPEQVVRSGGLAAGNGDPADPSAVACAAGMGVSLAAHRSTRVDAELLGWAHLILVMQGRHVVAIRRRWPRLRERVRLLGDYLPDPPHVLVDPWGEEAAVFERVFARLARAVDALAARIEARD